MKRQTTMPKKNRKEPQPVVEERKPKNPDIARWVEQAVLNELGTPPDMTWFKASNVFDNRWRVDIWCEKEVSGDLISAYSQHIKHSYFIHFNHNTYEIIKSTPEVKREYNGTVQEGNNKTIQSSKP